MTLAWPGLVEARRDFFLVVEPTQLGDGVPVRLAPNGAELDCGTTRAQRGLEHEHDLVLRRVALKLQPRLEGKGGRRVPQELPMAEARVDLVRRFEQRVDLAGRRGAHARGEARVVDLRRAQVPHKARAGSLVRFVAEREPILECLVRELDEVRHGGPAWLRHDRRCRPQPEA